MKNYCKHCGALLDPNQKHICPRLGMWRKIKNFFLSWINYDADTENDIDYYEREQAIVPDSVQADSYEIPIKQYDIATLRTRHKLTRAEGRMQITNKRILFRATGRSPVGKTVYQSEFAIDKIDGVEIRRDYRFLLWDFFVTALLSWWVVPIGMLLGTALTIGENVLLIILTFVLSLATSIPFFAFRKRYLLKLLVLGMGCGMMVASGIQATEIGSGVFCVFSALTLILLLVLYAISMFMSFFKPNLLIEVKTTGGMPSMQIKHKVTLHFIWKRSEENSGFSEVLPGKDADLAICEIGAIINDLKTLGDMGVEKWKSDVANISN